MTAQSWADHHRTQLPSWSRPGLARAGSRRPASIRVLRRDRAEPLTASTLVKQAATTYDSGERGGGSRAGTVAKDMRQKVVQLERSISFLKKQHLDTLQHLHKEIETLKRENRGVCRVYMCVSVSVHVCKSYMYA